MHVWSRWYSVRRLYDEDNEIRDADVELRIPVNFLPLVRSSYS
jgi:hypothetical protein